MAWKELSGTRKEQTQGYGPGPHYVDTIISFVGIEGTDNDNDAMPVEGNTYEDITGVASPLPSAWVNGGITTTLDAEPTVVAVSDSHKMTKLKCMVTCRFRALIVES